jgi:hypothetical protein
MCATNEDQAAPRPQHHQQGSERRPSAPTTLGRRAVLAGTGVGIASLALPAAAHASSLTFTSEPIASGPELTLWLDAANPASYSAGATTWVNLAGDGVGDVAIQAGATAPTFNVGGWFDFDGSQHLVAGTPVPSGSSYSAEAWAMDTSATQSGNRNILSSADDVIFLNGSTLYGGIGATYLLTSMPDFPPNVWRHVALTFDSVSKRTTLYVNGVQQSQATATGTYSGKQLYIGSHVNVASPTSWWQGRIAQIRTYTTELSASTVVQNFDASKARYSV